MRDLTSSDATSAASPEIRELLYLQRLSDALAEERWDDVRRFEPGKQTLTDEQFDTGWGPLEQQFIYPLERTDGPDGDGLWRIALIGHETWSGDDITTLFCVSWQVDGQTGEVVQTNEGTVRVFGPLADEPRMSGHIDPQGLDDVIVENCPLA